MVLLCRAPFVPQFLKVSHSPPNLWALLPLPESNISALSERLATDIAGIQGAQVILNISNVATYTALQVNNVICVTTIPSSPLRLPSLLSQHTSSCFCYPISAYTLLQPPPPHTHPPLFPSAIQHPIHITVPRRLRPIQYSILNHNCIRCTEPGRWSTLHSMWPINLVSHHFF